MKWLRGAAALAIVVWLGWLTIEMRKLGNVRRELAQHEASIRTLHSDLKPFHDDITAEVASLKAQLTMLRLAQRPVTRADLNSLASRIDILERSLRSIHSAGR